MKRPRYEYVVNEFASRNTPAKDVTFFDAYMTGIPTFKLPLAVRVVRDSPSPTIPIGDMSATVMWLKNGKWRPAPSSVQLMWQGGSDLHAIHQVLAQTYDQTPLGGYGEPLDD